MTEAIVGRVATGIAAHAEEHGLRAVSVVLHGGEPLLVGADRLDGILRTLGEALSGTAEVRFTIQTNGLLLSDPALLRVLHRHHVRTGVSLDGTAVTHDRHRRHASGRGSYAATAKALRMLGSASNRHLFAGLLCTVDLAADPVETYEALLEFGPPRIDLLLPHGTWQTPPPGLPGRTEPPTAPPTPAVLAASATPYAEWLCAVFDRWYGAPRQETGIRLFEELMALLMGGQASSEVLGLSPVDLVVVETDGTIEMADSLKISFDGAAATGMDVFRHSFSQAASAPPFRTHQRGLAGIGAVCVACPLVKTCGGGLYAHRYAPHTAEPFTHPSVYCADLAVLITHIRRRLGEDVAVLTTRAGNGAAPQ
jgi:uncharacterized protein